MVITKGSSEAEWIQIFRGIFTGLDMKGLDVESCVKDAENVPQAFREAFTAFEDREIFGGLHKLGVAIGDVVKAVIDCKLDQDVINRIEMFVQDLASCVSAGKSMFYIFLHL